MKNIKIWRVFFQILTHDNYEQTNGIQLDFFLCKSYAGNTAANQRIKYDTLQRS